VLGYGVFLNPILSAPDYLLQVSANEIQIITGSFLILVMAVAVAWIPVMLFPILKKQNETLAVGYVVFRALEAVCDIVIVISWLLLLTLSQGYVKAGLLLMFALISASSTTQWVLMLPLGLQEMVLGVWLIVKGFNSSAIASLPA
jgi:hypothetical protein